MNSVEDWTTRSAIVTGGGAGIGAATAIQLAALGTRVTVASLADGDGGEDVVDHILANGGQAQLTVGDLSVEDCVHRMVTQAESTFGPTDILVHAAGGVRSFAGVTALAADDWDRIVAVNLRSTFLVARSVIPSMAERGWGRVVTIASEAGRVSTRPLSPAYAAAKAGVIGFTKQVAREVAQKGVTVNTTAPSLTLTPRVVAGYDDAGDAIARVHPTGRLATPDEQAAVVVFLCSAGASYVNGACIDVTGGAVNI